MWNESMPATSPADKDSARSQQNINLKHLRLYLALEPCRRPGSSKPLMHQRQTASRALRFHVHLTAECEHNWRVIFLFL